MRVLICTCNSKVEIKTFAKNGYILDYENDDSDTNSESEFETQPQPQSGNHYLETISSLPPSLPPTKTMPGSFDEVEEEENRERLGEEGYTDGERGRSRKVAVKLGVEILGMTVVTERGRRWKVRELERSINPRGRGRFERKKFGGGWRWSW